VLRAALTKKLSFARSIDLKRVIAMRFFRLAVFLAATAIFTNAQAGLLGANVHGVMDAGKYGILVDKDNIVTDPGVEYLNSTGLFGADLSDTGLELFAKFLGGSALPIGANVTWTFTLLDPDLIFTTVAEVADTFTDGATFDGISNGGKTITFSIPNQMLTNSVAANYDFTVGHTSASVPLPAPIFLIALGVLGIGYSRRKMI
jgi:hypothetical protein